MRLHDEAVPGWYGKLPTLGDFASRRLDAAWISIWDTWLAEGLGALRENDDGWLDAYLASPAWRFVLMPRALPGDAGTRGCAGVLMASVDRVGRYFPLTLVAALDVVPRSTAQLDALLGWLARLEDIAVDAMQDDWSIDRLEQELAACPCPIEGEGEGDGDAPPDDALQRRLAGGAEPFIGDAPAEAAALGRRFADAAIAQAQSAWTGASFWLASSAQPPRMMITRGLPARREFAALFGAAPSAAATTDASATDASTTNP